MGIIELKAPVPKARRGAIPEWDFGIGGVIEIPRPARRVLPRLDQVLESRRSRRNFTRPPSLREVGDLLWHSTRVREIEWEGMKSVWESRPVPSGGGCHPIQIVLIAASFASSALLLYDAQYHTFGVHVVEDGKRVHLCIREVEVCLRVGKGTVLWFVADIGRTAAKYRNPESLVWRDSGALLATIGLVAEALSLNFCGLGFHEIGEARQILKLPRHIVGVGGCVVSGR